MSLSRVKKWLLGILFTAALTAPFWTLALLGALSDLKDSYGEEIEVLSQIFQIIAFVCAGFMYFWKERRRIRGAFQAIFIHRVDVIVVGAL